VFCCCSASWFLPSLSLSARNLMVSQPLSQIYLPIPPPQHSKPLIPSVFFFFFLSPIGRIHIHTYTHMLIGWKLLRSMININRWRCCWRRGAHESHIHLLRFEKLASYIYVCGPSPLYPLIRSLLSTIRFDFSIVKLFVIGQKYRNHLGSIILLE